MSTIPLDDLQFGQAGQCELALIGLAKGRNKAWQATASFPLINTLTNMQSTGLLFVDPQTHSAVRSTNSTHLPGHTGSMVQSVQLSSSKK